jgi:hypothetical protein
MSALVALFVAAPATASGQRVTADVVLRSGPVRGHVVIGDRPHVYRYDLDRRVGHRYPVRAIRVARLHVPRGQARGWWKRHGYRPVTLYVYAGRFYDRAAFNRLNRRGLAFRRVVVWQRGGRFYHDAPDRLGNDDRNRRVRDVGEREYRGYDD